MNMGMVTPSGIVTPTDTVELSHSQRAKLMDRVRRRDWVIKGAGATLLGVCGALAWLLIGDPAGMMPGMPGFWKGAPMILGAVFCGIYGALIMVLRRFSLSAVLVAMFAAGLSAFGAQSFVRTITDSELLALRIHVPDASKQAFAKDLGEAVTEARLKGLTGDLRAAGILEEPSAFDAALVTVGQDGDGDALELSARLIYCPFVHERRSTGRYLAMQYATLAAGVLAERTPGAIFEGRTSETLRVLTSYLSRRYPEHFAQPAAAAQWLAAREPDPEVKRVLEAYAQQP